MKFDLNLSDDSDYKMSYEQSEDSVKKLITEILDDKLSDLLDDLYLCESPIEKLLLVAMKNISAEYEGFSLEQMFVLDSQVEIECGNEKYRVDFMINYMEDQDTHRHLVIECDGREYHNKNKEQLERDYRKDRNLQMYGFDILRFSGSEITKSPKDCAREIMRYMRHVKRGVKPNIINREE